MELTKVTNASNTTKEAYVKPTMEVVELDMEDGILYADSTDGGQDGGYYQRGSTALAQNRGTRGNLWEKEENYL